MVEPARARWSRSPAAGEQERPVAAHREDWLAAIGRDGETDAECLAIADGYRDADTPAMVLAGATAISAGGCATEADLAVARALFEAVGHLITSGGLRISAGYAIHEGWVGELGWDLRVGAVVAIEAGARLDLHGESDAIALVGLPTLLVRLGAAIDTHTGTTAFRFQMELHLSAYFSRNYWHAAPGVVLFFENWFGRANRWVSSHRPRYELTRSSRIRVTPRRATSRTHDRARASGCWGCDSRGLAG